MSQTDTESKVRAAHELISERVRATRAAKRLTQQEVATQAGVKQSRVSELENGASDPKLSTVSRIVSALGLSLTVTDSAA